MSPKLSHIREVDGEYFLYFVSDALIRNGVSFFSGGQNHLSTGDIVFSRTRASLEVDDRLVWCDLYFPAIAESDHDNRLIYSHLYFPDAWKYMCWKTYDKAVVVEYVLRYS